MSMLVRTLLPHRGTGRGRSVGEVYGLNLQAARTLIASGTVMPVEDAAAPDWYARPGRELRITADTPCGRPVVACLSIWNDLPALRRTWASWAPHVDAVVVFDGPCNGQAGEGSEDGLHDWLKRGAPWEGEEGTLAWRCDTWADQRVKRTALLQCAAAQYPEALLFIVDADEYVEGAERLRALPEMEVGWLTVASPSLYARRYGQPRVVRAQPELEYRGRHHWLYAGARLLATHQYGGAGVLHRLTGLSLVNNRGLGHTPARAAAKRAGQVAQFLPEEAVRTSPRAAASDAATGARESLRLLQVGPFDAGMVAYRLHTALNTATPHAALLGTMHASNPFTAPVGYDLASDWDACARAFDEADVVHCHLSYGILGWLERLGRAKEKWVVIHHHGTMYREKPGPEHFNAVDRSWAGLRLVSNLELLQYGTGLHWLPNPMPVAEYGALRARLAPRAPHPFRVAHSPSKRALKGTEEFLAACARLQRRGVAIEPVLIEGLSHAQALATKATCDAIFDSFWLGMQCSGLEGGAMGLPVIAGAVDQPYVASGTWHEVPYTRADTEEELVLALEMLAADPDLRASEGARVHQFIAARHDEAVVALQYLDHLDTAFHWRERLRVGSKRPGLLSNVAPEPRRPQARRPEQVVPEMPLVPAGPPEPLRREG